MKKYPHNCFVMTMYQSLLMALVYLPFSVLENWGLKKCHYTETEVLPSRFKMMTDDDHLYTVPLLYTAVISISYNYI